MEKKTKNNKIKQTENAKYVQEFRKDFHKCIKNLVSFKDQKTLDKNLDNLSKHIRNQEIYNNYLTTITQALNIIPENDRETVLNMFEQGINVGMILTLGAILNNTGYFADCLYYEDEDVTNKTNSKSEKVKKL